MAHPLFAHAAALQEAAAATATTALNAKCETATFAAKPVIWHVTAGARVLLAVTTTTIKATATATTANDHEVTTEEEEEEEEEEEGRTTI